MRTNAAPQSPAGPAERDAVGGMYSEHAPQVLRFVLARVGDPLLAEDLTAETFVRALRALGRSSVAIGDSRAWLVTIAANLVRDHYRSRARRPQIIVTGVDQGGAFMVEPEQEILAREAAAELRHAIAQLTPAQRRCVRLRFLEELSVTETAAVMGCCEGTVKSLRYQALRRLARLLAAETNPAPPLARRDRRAPAESVACRG